MSVTSSITSLATKHLVLNSDLSPNASIFDVLPEEIVVRILEWCDVGGVLACKRTCRAFRNMIAGSASLRYKLALSENGMCDETRSHMTVAEKLELLTAHAAAWRRLHAVRHEWVESLVGWSAPLAVSGNIFVFSRKCNDIRGEHEAVFPAAPVEPHLDLLVVRVPSPHRRVEGAQWMLWIPESEVELCIDAAQDLLVYMLDRTTFCVLTLSTGVVHPLVIGHAGCFKTWEGNSTLSFSVFGIRVWGDFIAAGTSGGFVPIWNWKTAALVSCEQISDMNFSSFDFLDEHHILYADSSEDCIIVYDLRCSLLATRAEEGHLRFQLNLLPIHRARTSRYIQIRRNALPIQGQERIQDEFHDGGNDGGGTRTWAPPFHIDPRARLVVLRIVTSPAGLGEEQFELHVPAQALLDHFAANRDTGSDVVLPWSAWCASTTVTPARRVPYLPQARMIAYGMRTVSHPPDWDEGVLYLNSYPPRRAGTIGAGTRKGIPLPDKPLEESTLLYALCEDGLLCYQLNSSLTGIVHAYWLTP